jgi:hypothetical protein
MKPGAIAKPYALISDFILYYKSISKFIDIERLKDASLVIVEDQRGCYYGEVFDGMKNGEGVYFGIDGTVY